MAEIGIIGGTGFDDWGMFEIEETKEEESPWGTPSSPLYFGKVIDRDIVLLLRHGPERDIPPHRINHRANIYCLQKEVESIIGVSSAGALHDKIEVPSISIPEDYVNFWNIISFYNEEIKHVTPGISKDMKDELLDSVKEIKGDLKVREDDIYVQTSGPRLETRGEVHVLSGFGDIVGMTMAPEATLSKEANIDYASIVSIDNYANGVTERTIRYEDIVESAQENWKSITGILESYLR